MKYDYLIVGAGLSGATAAYILSNKGYKVLVIEKRNHIGGNCYCENIEGINVHKYGPHIFHTSDKEVWNFITSLVEFNNYQHYVIANNNGKLYNLPFNMNTFIKLWPNIITPQQVKEKILSQCNNSNAKNLEDWVRSNVGEDIYETFIKYYTEKQWNKKCSELSPDIIKRIPIRYNFNNSYFNDIYQGIPINGYNELFEKLLKNVDIALNTDYFDDREFFDNIAEKIIYTGPIDKYYNYCFGKLQYRSLKFDNEILNISNYQGCAVINYTDNTPYTRIIEHKHFSCLTNEEIYNNSKTIITREYPKDYDGTNEPYYPVFTKDNIELYNKYKELANKENNILFIGRLAEYKYYDMDDTIKNIIKIL